MVPSPEVEAWVDGVNSRPPSEDGVVEVMVVVGFHVTDCTGSAVMDGLAGTGAAAVADGVDEVVRVGVAEAGRAGEDEVVGRGTDVDGAGVADTERDGGGEAVGRGVDAEDDGAGAAEELVAMAAGLDGPAGEGAGEGASTDTRWIRVWEPKTS